MKRVRNYRSRFIAPLLAGALVITPLGAMALPATADETTDSNSQNLSVTDADLDEAVDETESDAPAAPTGDDSTEDKAPAAPTVDDAHEGDAPAAPTADDAPEGDAAPGEELGEDEGETETLVAPLALADATHSIAEARQLPDGSEVTVHGVVTAAYTEGNFRGFVLQTQGTGGDNKSEGVSDAIFVYENGPASVAIGDFVEVSGQTGEFYGLKQISKGASDDFIEVLSEEEFEPVTPVTMAWPKTDEERAEYASMLFMPTGDYTVTSTYTTHRYGEVMLAFGDTPLLQPTDVALPGSAAKAIEDQNAERVVILDDGRTTDFAPFNESSGNRQLIPPYVSEENPVRVGAPVTFTEPVIIDFRNDAWKLNPTTAISPGEEPADFKNTRRDPNREQIGDSDVTIAGFNVLNYFTTTGEDWESSSRGTCTYYSDKDLNPITTNNCTNNGPRGAANDASLKRQEDKIVAAINKLDASVVGLMEIENSAALGEETDEALITLVRALNEAAEGEKKWAYVPSSVDLPDASSMDVISNAIIYQPTEVELVGTSRALGDQSAQGEAFGNAREPLGQAFVPAEGGEPFFVAVNHFKSKGSGSGENADQGDGQAASNPDRKRQASALVEWLDEVLPEIEEETGIEVVDTALMGDFNSYSQEDPMQIFYNAGFKNANALTPGQYSYSYDGLSGSLDHVLYNADMADRVTGADIWEINSPESIALEYSRYNGHGKQFYEANEFRSSDHDPVVIGLQNGQDSNQDPNLVDFNLLGINDFHGRIDSNTVLFAGTVEESRAQYPDRTVFLSAGDNIGASLFASALLEDKPTIDVLNALDLQASAVGNHEFDSSYANLTGQVQDWANFPYLGANVYKKGTTEPALPEYEVVTVDGVNFGLIGVVTQETPTLVTPGGIATLEFGDPVDAVNRVAAQLSDGDLTNGEADVIVALYHEGAGSGEPDGSDLDAEVAASAVFKKIVVDSTDEVDVIFTGHTHKQYAWLDTVPNPDRPVIQTGNYGEFIGQSVVTVDTETNSVVAATADNLARLNIDKGIEGDDAKAAAMAALKAELISTYPRVAEVNEIVEAALAIAAVEGNVPVGSVTADITTAHSDGSYVDGVWTGTKRDDRASESSLSTLVANSLRDSLSEELRGGADFGVVNAGGLRSELLYAGSDVGEGDGVVTYAEANAVLPFVNNLWTTGLTGDQVKDMLEQQWQRGADGEVPSRDYLHLGLSDNVTYTFDATLEEGSRITSITINGDPIDPERTYTVGTFSFLAQGGDNFHVFKDSTGTRDSGLIDRDAWVDYLGANPDLGPSFARAGVQVPMVADNAEVGQEIEFPVSSLNMTSLGSPENTELTATLVNDQARAVGEAVGTFEVVDGATVVKFTVPASAAGATTLVLQATESGTTVTLPMAVAGDGDGGPGDGDGDGGPGDGDGGPGDGDGNGGAGDGDTDGKGDGPGNGKLPLTGADVMLPLIVTVLLLAAGTAAVIARRRRA